MPRAGGSCLFRVGCRLCAAFESFCPSFIRSNSNTTTDFTFPADGGLFLGFCAKAVILQNCPIRRYPQYSHKISQRTFSLSRPFLPEPRFLFIKKTATAPVDSEAAAVFRSNAVLFAKRAIAFKIRRLGLVRFSRFQKRDAGRFVVRRGLKIRPVDWVDEAQRRFDDRKMPRRALRRRIPYSTVRATRAF